jgi:hypothetical protein
MSAPSQDVPRTIRFFNNVLPALEAADYALAVRQDVTETGSATIPAFNASRNFSVVAPRFALPSADVQSVFPPGNGVYDQNLAHIVLTEPLLPWERLITQGDDSTKKTPWMALLVLRPDEIVAPQGAATQTGAGTYAIGPDPNNAQRLVLSPIDGQTLGPAIGPLVGDATTCAAIDLTTQTFTQLVPRLAELPYLAHGRDVEPVMPLKVTEIAVQDGMFSIVVGNRFPQAAPAPPPGTAPTPLPYVAHLVSLEGFAPYLVDAPAWPAGIKKVRLVSLYSWSFATLPAQGNFAALMLNLTAGQAKGGDGLRLRLTPNVVPAPPAGSPLDLAQRALGQGFAALQYDTRAGDQTFAWYHGPFVPHPLAPFAAHAPFPSAAAATIYDPDSGTFDLSYAAGWELGRLLALSDGAYTSNTLATQRALRRTVNLLRERTRTARGTTLLAAGATTASSANVAALTQLLQADAPARSFASWLTGALPALLPRPGEKAIAPTEPALLLRAPRTTAVAGVQSLAARADVQAVLGSTFTASLADGGHAAGVVATLAGLRLLQNVPFAHLVPDARMLPAESIRFFYVDVNYLDALCDGASSIGVQTTRDATQRAAVRGAVRKAATVHAFAARATAIRRPQLLQAAQPNDPVAGFLLRSAVVSGWPGLEVKAYADAAGTQPIQPVRMDRTLAPDVMLALYPQVPARIEFDEPKEALAFGVEDPRTKGGDPVVYLRFIDGANIGKVTGAYEARGAQYLRGDSRVLKVAAWQAQLATHFTSSTTAWGPASFAIQMVRAAEQMIFENADA